MDLLDNNTTLWSILQAEICKKYAQLKFQDEPSVAITELSREGEDSLTRENKVRGQFYIIITNYCPAIRMSSISNYFLLCFAFLISNCIGYPTIFKDSLYVSYRSRRQISHPKI